MPAMLRLEAPRTFFRTVGPQRAPNSALRSREYLTSVEVEKLISAARSGRGYARVSTTGQTRMTANVGRDTLLSGAAYTVANVGLPGDAAEI